MAIDHTRRAVLRAALLTLSPTLLGCQSRMLSAGLDQDQPALIGTAKAGTSNEYLAVVIDKAGTPILRMPLPERGHGIAIEPNSQQAVVFSRRPGTYFTVFNYTSGENVHVEKSSPRRFYYGHGAFSNCGRWLYASEGEIGTCRGIVGVYDADRAFNKVDELTGFGVGPHELSVMEDGRIVVAVGGIVTKGRQKQNLDTMQPSLIYLNPQGRILEQATLTHHQLSIRHLSVCSKTDMVFFGQQSNAQQLQSRPLLAGHKMTEQSFEFYAEPEEWDRFNGYIGSVACNEEYVVATSPRGNCYGIWSIKTRNLVELAPLMDVSGVAVREDMICLSSGSGQIVFAQEESLRRRVNTGIIWDNHWTSVEV